MGDTKLNLDQARMLEYLKASFKGIIYKSFSDIIPSEALNNALDSLTNSLLANYFQNRRSQITHLQHFHYPLHHSVSKELEDVQAILKVIEDKEEQIDLKLQRKQLDDFVPSFFKKHNQGE